MKVKFVIFALIFVYWFLRLGSMIKILLNNIIFFFFGGGGGVGQGVGFGGVNPGGGFVSYCFPFMLCLHVCTLSANK